ncbi:MAG: aminotransferase class I/II-fold pyridoxal phosphate-dependent enzyme [Candidatus Brocadiia bacterium]
MEKRPTILPFSRPCIGEDEIAAVADVLRSGWITSGPRTAEFERTFAKFAGTEYALSVTSATAGLHLLLLALGVHRGDEVVMPSLTFACDANIVELLGAMPVFADVNPKTLNSDPEHIAAVLTPHTKAVIAVHFAGFPVDLDGYARVMRKSKAVLIEDAAHCVGTSYKGRPIGSHGNTAFWSFHPIKNITTGEGGMITTSDGELAARMKLLRFHGIEKDAWQRYGDRSSPGYDVLGPGLKQNFTDIQSAIGLVQMAKLAAMNARRREIDTIYRSTLAGVSGLALQTPPSYDHVPSYHLEVVQVKDREGFSRALRDDWNVSVALHFPPLHGLAYYRAKYGAVSLPGAQLAGSRVLSLPMFPDMTDEDAHYVCGAVKEVLRKP